MTDRTASRLEAIAKGVDCHVSADSYVRTCLAALGVFVEGAISAIGWAGGWDPIDEDEAAYAARAGQPVVAISGGDVAIVLPSREGDGLWVAQGGAAARSRAPLAAAFGLRRPDYWRHA